MNKKNENCKEEVKCASTKKGTQCDSKSETAKKGCEKK